MESLIRRFGYVVIVIGTIAEGGTALTIGGFLAHQGYLELIPWVVAAGFVGGAIDGQAWFLLGRRFGARLLERRQSWKSGFSRVDAAFRRHPAWLIVGGRFVPGARTLSWIAAGMSSVPMGRYALLNLLGALLWSVAVGGSGYLFGRVMQAVLGEIKHLELPIVAAIAVIASIWWIAWRRGYPTARRLPTGRP